MAADLSAPLPKPGKGQLKGWHALMWFVGFFGFMFVVNGIFLWTAITTFPGEDVQKSYATGLDYNRELARRARQAEAGWTAEIGLAGPDEDREVRVRLMSRDGSALPAAGTHLQMRHPADRNLDQALDLVPVGGGEYTARIDSLTSGNWTVRFTADIDPATEGHEFHAEREIHLP
ncbi:MAG: FixH family protein [Hyphomonas sp.]|nr:FixH family protein [Hyphomonas sp.]